MVTLGALMYTLCVFLHPGGWLLSKVLHVATYTSRSDAVYLTAPSSHNIVDGQGAKKL